MIISSGIEDSRKEVQNEHKNTKRQLKYLLIKIDDFPLWKMFGFGVHSAREIPVPIPNTEVKPGSGDYTAQAGN